MERKRGNGEGEKVGKLEEQKGRKRTIRHFRDLEVYRRAFDAAMEIFQMTKGFPSEEKFSLVDQIRRSSRSVCANLAEGWRKRKYVAVKLVSC